MMRLKYVLSVILICAVAAGLWSRRSPAPVAIPVIEVAKEKPPKTAEAALTKFKRNTSKERLPNFLADEAKQVGAIDANPQATTERLGIVAQALDAEESAWLGQRALDAKEDGDARFLSVYLLAKGNPDNSLEALKQIAVAKLPQKTSESRLDLERQIRAMAIEGISGARGVTAARDELKEIAARQTDPFLYDRAQRGLYSWNTGKKIEDQDKEALRELREKNQK